MISDTFPNAIVYPAHPSNYYAPAVHGGVPNKPRGLVLHTPEEPADSNPYTPKFFADPNRQASTHYYGHSSGQLYQLVPEDCMAIANGLLGKPCPAWADPNTSLNWQTINIEIEGYAASMAQTCPRGSLQWNSLVSWIQVLCQKYNIPIDRAHIIGHYQVANNRTDPGTLDIDGLVRDAQGQPEALEDDMAPAAWVRDTENGKSYIIVGGRKRHVESAAQEKALLDAGYIVRPEKTLTTAELATIPDA